MNDDARHQLLGAYLLGGLEPAEARSFSEHLAGCPQCRRELDELESLPALLDAVPVPDALALTSRATPQPAPDDVPAALVVQLAASRRKVRRRWLALVAGVAATFLGLGLLAGPLLNQAPRPDASYSVQADNGLQLTVGMVKKNWGTELSLDGRSLPLDGTYSLWVKGRDGVEDRACAWSATTSGRVRVTGATPVQLAVITGVELRDGQQHTLASISVTGR